jgi:hypothetical protein
MIKVKVLQNHTVKNGKIRAKGTEYLCDPLLLPFRVKIGLVEVIKEKKTKDASTNKGDK